jgi:hypothetical protein
MQRPAKHCHCGIGTGKIVADVSRAQPEFAYVFWLLARYG